MGVYKKAVITDAGRALMARSIAGEAIMQFSRVITSNHTYPSETDFKGYVSLEGIQQTVIPSNVQIANDTLISVRGLFGNESISESYLIQNIGLYATDGVNEVLFSVSQATTPDEMPAYNGVAPSSFIYTIQATVSQANSLSLTINPAGTATTQDIVDLDGAKLDSDGDISETMAETLEPFTDKFPIPSAGDKIKSFFGKIITFLKNIKPLEADVTYYVATTGSDITGDGTSSKPFKTVQHAIDILPKNSGGHIASIFIDPGTYDEDISISGFGNTGRLMLLPTGNISIRSLSVFGSYLAITSSNSSAPRTVTTKYLLIADCAIFNAWATINIITTGSVVDLTTATNNCSIIVTRSSLAYISGLTSLTNNTDAGIMLANMSDVYVYSLSGNGFTYGVNVYSASQVTIVSNTLVATTPTTAAFGGRIISGNGTQISNVISSGLSCTWGVLYNGYVKHGNQNGYAVVTVMLYLKTTTPLSLGNTYYITGLPKPAVSLDFAVTVSPQYSVRNCAIYASDGRIGFTPSVNIDVNNALSFCATYITNS